MPDFDFDAFNHEYPEGEEGYGDNEGKEQEQNIPISKEEVTKENFVEEPAKQNVVDLKSDDFINPTATEEVDKW